MITSQRELKRAIFDKKESLKEKELFMSEAYDEFLTQMQHGVTSCEHLGTSHLEIMDEGRIAYTDGDDTFINYKSLFTKGKTRLQKHDIFCGLNLHESGHLLFTDFALHKKVLAELEKGKIYPSPIANKYLQEVEDFLAQGYADYIAGLFHKLDNCIEDGFVDRAIMKITPGYAKCLRYVNSLDKICECETYEEMTQKKMPKVDIFANMVLFYARHGIVLYDKATPTDEVIEAFEEVMPIIKDAVFTAIPFSRKKKAFLVFCYLFHFVQMQQQQNQNGNSGQNGQQNQSGQQQSGQQQGQGNSENSQSGNQSSQNNSSQSSSDGSEQNGQDSKQPNGQNGSSENSQGTGENTPSLQDMLKQLGDSLANTEKNEHKNASSTSEADLRKLEELMKNSSSQTEKEESKGEKKESSDSSALEKIATQVAVSQLAKEQEKEMAAQGATDVKAFLDGVSSHAGISSSFSRQDISSTGKTLYEAQHKELDFIVRRLVSEFEKEIKDRQTGDTLTGLYSGKRFTARDAHRFDKKVFNRKILPEDIPDMAVGMLVDLSGSMSGRRLQEAIKTVYITYTFCRRLNIPVFVIGHSTNGSKVILKSIVDENCLDEKDKFRIFEMSTYSCNRDGYALRYCLKRLERMQAEQKLMFVISDGKPNHDGYGLYSGKADCQEAVSEAIKKGIFTITAGIGDSESVRAVYKVDNNGKELSAKSSATYLDLSDLKKLPKSFVKILKEKLS